jgi:hypothetical protein
MHYEVGRASLERGKGLWRHRQIMGFFPVSFLPGEKKVKNGSNWWCNVLSNRNRSESEGPFIFYSLLFY